jgi:hypothetical protein
MAASTGVVVVQPGNRVEPEEPTQIGAGRIDRPAQTLFEGSLNLAGKAELSETLDQRAVEAIGIGRSGALDLKQTRARNGQ